jgi:hypothetical protein
VSRRRGRQEGASLVELMLLVSMMAFAVTVITKFAADAQFQLVTLENKGDLASMTSRINSNLSNTLSQAERIYVPFDGGTDYSDMLALVRNSIAANTSLREPREAPGIYLSTPTAKNAKRPVEIPASFGNLIALAVATTPLRFKVSPTATTMEEVVIDRYQFVYIYPSLDSQTVFDGFTRIRLVEWRSKPYPSSTQLSSFSTNKLTLTVQGLQNLGYSHAFDATQSDPDVAFYRLSGTTAPYFINCSIPAGAPLVTNLPSYAWGYLDEFIGSLQQDPVITKVPGRISRVSYLRGVAGFPSSYSIAYNSVSPNVVPQYKVNQLFGRGGDLVVPAYGVPSATGPFPGGFEIGILGSANAREIWGRTAVMAKSGARPRQGWVTKSYESFASGFNVSVRVND